MLEKELNRAKLNFVDAMNALERQALVTARVDEAFRVAHRLLEWTNMTVDGISIGLAPLASGRLPPQKFSNGTIKDGSVRMEFETTFEFNEILVLPVYDAKDGVGLRHSSLPQFLLVAGDKKNFIELSEEEVRACKDSSDDWLLQTSYQRESSTSWEDPPVISTKGYTLDVAIIIGRQVSKTGVDVTTIYNRLNPWRERGHPNSGRVSRKIEELVS
ncbi:Uncharacterized protein APZ42_025247 [Daphnia magna]|uniref:Uncharacterized protein n=1 Tax=Daphnia magna TaxID=35525 RepID=A0A164TBH9_9CRUS|nr:Uncharacterized protein APZ42_025247 [Daphnia magna]